MTRPAAPTQSDVLRQRASRVPWRRVFGDAIRGLTGRGPMVLPDRLEGAVYGQLLAGTPASDRGGGTLLDDLERGLSRARPVVPAAGSPELGLATALVLRREAAEVVATAATAVLPTVDPDVAAGAVVYALVVRAFLAGERDRRSALAHARRHADAVRLEAACDAIHADPGSTFDAAWRAFEPASDYVDVMARISCLDGRPAAVAIAGGLAGTYWGSSGIPLARRRSVPEPVRARRIVDQLIETDVPGRDGRAWQTSTSAPLDVHHVDVAGLNGANAGSIGITPLPGRRYVAYHTGAHWRDLDTDARRLRELGVDLLLLLVEDRELARCRVTGIEGVLRDRGIDVVRHPIRDPLVPRDGTRFRATVASTLREVQGGRCVAVACRGGFDRAGMTAACLLREAGLDASTAIERVQRARPGALALPDQQAYVRGWPPGR